MALRISLPILTTIICWIAAFCTGNVQAVESREGSSDVMLGEQPWLALLRVPGGASCSAAIASHTALLSAALCPNPVGGTAYAGNVKYGQPVEFDHQTQNRSIVEYHLYDENNTLRYNFMLVKIDPKWTWSESVQPIGIVEKERLPQNFGAQCYVSGLGGHDADGRQVARVSPAQLAACAGGSAPQGRRLCDAGATLDTSAGDLGGPVLCDGKLYGIISEVRQSASGELQEFHIIPTFEFVGFYGPWIKKTAGDLPSDAEVEFIRRQNEPESARPLGLKGLVRIKRDAAGTTPATTEDGAERGRGAALAALLAAAGAARAL